jgi:hypothetical protein
VVLAVKTPIGLIGLIGIALIAIYRKNGEASWQQKLTGWFALAILLLCMSSSINLGVRHILAIYPILAVLAGYGVARAKSRPMKLAALALTGTVMVESWRAHPDYLAYFNPLAGERPEAVLVESDLDWGQDLKRLSARLKTLGIRKIGIGYFGTADLRRAELPEYELMDGHSKKSGYVAVSVRNLTLERVKNGAYEWLKDQEPIEKIGKTIWLYYVRD